MNLLERLTFRKPRDGPVLVLADHLHWWNASTPEFKRNLQRFKEVIDRYGGLGKRIALEITPNMVRYLKSQPVLDTSGHPFFGFVAHYALGKGMEVIPLESNDYVTHLQRVASAPGAHIDLSEVLGGELTLKQFAHGWRYITDVRDRRFVGILKKQPCDMIGLGYGHGGAIRREIPTSREVRITTLWSRLTRFLFRKLVVDPLVWWARRDVGIRRKAGRERLAAEKEAYPRT